MNNQYRLIKSLLLMIMLLFIFKSVEVSGQSSSCMDRLKSAYANFIPRDTLNRITRLEMKITRRDQKNAIYQDTITTVYRKNSFYVRTGDYEVFQDDTNTFAIFHNRRKIFIYENPDNPAQLVFLQKQNLFIDSLDKFYDVVACDTLRYKNHICNKISLLNKTPGKYDKAADTVVVYFKLLTRDFVEMRYVYPSFSQIKELIIDYTSFDRNFTSNIFNFPLKRQIFEENGNLKSQFTNYQLKDNRRRE